MGYLQHPAFRYSTWVHTYRALLHYVNLQLHLCYIVDAIGDVGVGTWWGPEGVNIGMALDP